MNHLLRELAPVSDAAWAEIEDELGQFEGSEGFTARCELIGGAGINDTQAPTVG